MNRVIFARLESDPTVSPHRLTLPRMQETQYSVEALIVEFCRGGVAAVTSTSHVRLSPGFEVVAHLECASAVLAPIAGRIG